VDPLFHHLQKDLKKPNPCFFLSIKFLPTVKANGPNMGPRIACAIKDIIPDLAIPPKVVGPLSFCPHPSPV
jgi:hypothetical protein